jgi:hypothetical protein
VGTNVPAARRGGERGGGGEAWAGMNNEVV